jgi:hypothetical protein
MAIRLSLKVSRTSWRTGRALRSSGELRLHSSNIVEEGMPASTAQHVAWRWIQAASRQGMSYQAAYRAGWLSVHTGQAGCQSLWRPRHSAVLE